MGAHESQSWQSTTERTSILHTRTYSNQSTLHPPTSYHGKLSYSEQLDDSYLWILEQLTCGWIVDLQVAIVLSSLWNVRSYSRYLHITLCPFIDCRPAIVISSPLAWRSQILSIMTLTIFSELSLGSFHRIPGTAYSDPRTVKSFRHDSHGFISMDK